MKVIILTITRDNGTMITHDTKNKTKTLNYHNAIKLLCSFEMPAYGPYETMMLYANNITLKPPNHIETPKSHGTGLCASRHNSVHFLNISTSKSGPRIVNFEQQHSNSWLFNLFAHLHLLSSGSFSSLIFFLLLCSDSSHLCFSICLLKQHKISYL